MIWKNICAYYWGLPILSFSLLVLSVPPISLWWLSFVGFIPLLLFFYVARTNGKRAVGMLLFVSLHAGYLTNTTLSEFVWLEQADLFVTFVKLAGLFAAVMVGLIAGGYFYLWSFVVRDVFRLSLHAQIAVLGVAYVLMEYVYAVAYANFNYGAIFFGSQHLELVRVFVELGDPVFVSLATVLLSLGLSYLFLAMVGVASRQVAFAGMLILMTVVCLSLILRDQVLLSAESVAIAIIQDSSREDETAFGSIVNGVFEFPELEAHLAEINTTDTEIIIYPFAPWSGVMSDSLDNRRFDRDVIGMSDEIFRDWLREHVASDKIFVAWYTTYRDGAYYNEIGYYQNGEPIVTYWKNELFPFFDYVPQWALDVGIVSLPFDATPGEGYPLFVHNETIRISSLVCSEIGSHSATSKAAAQADMILSLGSETMFNHQIPAEFNANLSQLSAEKHNIPLVRANKFGPSVVYDGNGDELGRIEYNETKILYVDVPIPLR